MSLWLISSMVAAAKGESVEGEVSIGDAGVGLSVPRCHKVSHVTFGAGLLCYGPLPAPSFGGAELIINHGCSLTQ